LRLPCTNEETSAGRVTLVFSGLAAFVPDGRKALTVLFPDVRRKTAHVPVHRPALAHLRVDAADRLVCDPIVKVLEQEVLMLRSGGPGRPGAEIAFDASHLAEMQKASGTKDARHGRMHKDCVRELRRCLAALQLDAKRLGVDVRTVYPKGSADAFFGEGEPYQAQLTDELRLVMALPGDPLVLEGRRSGELAWQIVVSEPGDKAAYLLVLNLPIDDPNPSGHAVDHHFDRYYDLLQSSPPKRRLPQYEGSHVRGGARARPRGGHVPKCAMAVLSP
jgi:hypothetical protein